jgi:hypothetical protein
MQRRDLATAGVFGNRHEAEVARARLEASGVEAWVQADDVGGYEPQLGLTNGVRVLVPAEYLAAANEVLEPTEPARTVPTRGWVTLVAFVVAVTLIAMVSLPLLVTGWRWLT